jgi:hypothetical protein
MCWLGSNRNCSGTGGAKSGSKVPAADLLKAWMDPSFLGTLQLNMNSNLPSNSSINNVSESDISSFIRVELFLSFYKVSTDLYFNKDHSSEFPSAAFGMSHKKYAQMLVALGGTKARHRFQEQCWHLVAVNDSQFPCRVRHGTSSEDL